MPLPDGPPGTTVIGAGRPVDPVMILRGRRVRLICPTTGLELPETFWQRRVGNNVTRVIENSPKIELRVDIGRGMSTVTLAIRDFQREDEGEYICITRNSGGTDQADVTLELETSKLV